MWGSRLDVNLHHPQTASAGDTSGDSFLIVCVKNSHFKPFTDLYDVCKSDNINRSVQFVFMARKGADNWQGTGLGCCQIEQVAIFCSLIFHICKKIGNFWQQSKKKKKKTIEKKWICHFKTNERTKKFECAFELWDNIFFCLVVRLSTHLSCVFP